MVRVRAGRRRRSRRHQVAAAAIATTAGFTPLCSAPLPAPQRVGGRLLRTWAFNENLPSVPGVYSDTELRLVMPACTTGIALHDVPQTHALVAALSMELA